MQRIGAIIAALALLLLTHADAQTPDSVPGCVYNATPPTLTTGQVVEWQCDINGKLITSGGGGGGGSPGGVSGNVQTNDGAGGFGGLTDTQLTARINAATTALSGALPAWPNNSTTFLRGDGTYAAVGFSAITGFGTGVATALGINVGQAGALVTMNGALGTPSSGTLTSATGLPISTGLTGAGTGVLTALGVNVGSAGAPVLFNGAGGTPSSLALANATGCTISGCVSGLGTGVATLLSGNASGTGGPAGTTSPTFTTPALGVATGTSLALGGCTIGANALCATGTANISGASTLGGAITYGGVTLSNAVTGTGNMVLSASPTLTGTFLATNGTFSGQMSAATLAGAAFGTGVATLLGGASSGTGGPAGTTSPSFTTPSLGDASATGLTLGNSQFFNMKDSGGTAQHVLVADGSNNTIYTAVGSGGAVEFFNYARSNINLQMTDAGHLLLAHLSTSSGVQSGYACFGSGGEIINDSGVCLASLRGIKDDRGVYTSGLDFVRGLTPHAFTYKKENVERPSLSGEMVGLFAEDVASVDARFAVYDDNGKLQGVRYELLSAALISAIKTQQTQIEELQSRIATFEAAVK